MPIDFNNIQTTRGRGYDANMISMLNDSLQAVPIKQRAAILGSVIEESGGNPLARSASNAYQGLLQWGKDRYRIASNDKEREFTKQIELIRKTLNDSTDHISWSHGGEGSGYKSFKEPLHIFHNPELPFEDIYRAFSYGYVRPKGKEESYSNRLRVAQQVYSRLNAQPNPTLTKQDIVDAAMTIPTAIAEGMDKAVTFGKSMFPQTSQKGSPNKKDNTMRWAEGGFLYQPKDAWDSLSMLEKSEMMKVAVRNGITDLKTIREKYNEFAEGGDTKWTMEDEAKYMKWRQSLPDNLRLTNDSDYDMRAAFKAGMQPTLESDSLYHLGSRDPETGRILKAPHHPTYLQAINTDARMGYYPVVDDKGQTYTRTWEGNKFAEGGIYIKPENRGKFTRLKERTGHSATWFKEHGTPAQKKMATFALNSRHWKHSDGGPLFECINLFETGGPKRQAVQARPAKRNRFEDMSIEELEASAKSTDEYWRRQQEELANRTPEQIRQMGEEADRRYRERNPNGGEADPSLQRAANVVIGAMQQQIPFTGKDIKQAAEEQRQQKLDKWHDYKKGIESTLTATELLAAGYGVSRGLLHLGEYGANRAGRTSLAGTLGSWADKWDKPQVLMNGLGTTADIGQLLTSTNPFDTWENSIEAGAGTAGIIGGTNWFRGRPFFGRYGNTIDNILDAAGYGAASWDVVKNLPPLSDALEGIRNQSEKTKALGGPLVEQALNNQYGGGGFLDWLKGLFTSDDIDPNAKNLEAVIQHKKKHGVKNTSWYIDPSTNTGYRIQGDKVAEKFEVISGLNTNSDGYTDLTKDANGNPVYSSSGNLRSTGAGVFTLSRPYQGYGEPLFFMQEGRGNSKGYKYAGNKNRTGRQTNQAIHAPADESREALLADMNDDNNHASFGCVSPSYGMLKYWTENGIMSPGDTVYVQPTVEGNFLHYDPKVSRIVTHYKETPSTVTGKNYGVKFKLNNVRYNKGF